MTVLGAGKSVTALTLSGLLQSLRCDEVPKVLHLLTQEVALCWLKLHAGRLNLLDMLHVILQGSGQDQDVINVDRHKARTLRRIQSTQYQDISLWKMAGASVRPKGITQNSNSSWGVTKAVFSIEPSATLICQNPAAKPRVVKYLADSICSRRSSILGRGYISSFVIELETAIVHTHAVCSVLTD